MTKTNVFIDSDLGWDDWCAISLLAKSDQINIVGIAVNGCGEAYLSDAVQNCLDILNLLECTDIPVGIGAGAPSSYSNVFPSDFRETMSSLMGYTLPRSSVDPATLDNADTVLNNALDNYPGLVYLSIGGFTNLYNFWQNQTQFNKGPQQIVAMGGAVNVPGNVSDLFPEAYPNNNTAEWNIFIDPKAADFVVQKCQEESLELRFSPLDASYQVPLTAFVVNKITMCSAPTPLSLFLGYILSTRFDQAKQRGYQEYFYDPFAAATLIEPSLTNNTFGTFSVNTDFDEMDNRSGQLTFSSDQTKKSCYGTVNSPNSFYQLFLTTLFPECEPDVS